MKKTINPKIQFFYPNAWLCMSFEMPMNRQSQVLSSVLPPEREIGLEAVWSESGKVNSIVPLGVESIKPQLFFNSFLREITTGCKENTSLLRDFFKIPSCQKKFLARNKWFWQWRYKVYYTQEWNPCQKRLRSVATMYTFSFSVIGSRKFAIITGWFLCTIFASKSSSL